MLKSVLVSSLSRSSSQIFAFCFALHVLLGLTNKLCESLEGVWPDFHLWPESLHLEREAYHNRCFEVRDA